MQANASDEELMVAFRDSEDLAAFDILYSRYRARIYAYHLTMRRNDPAVAEDLTQETFCRVIDKKTLFHPMRGTFGVWLFMLAANINRDLWRRLKHMASVALEERIDPAPRSTDTLIADCLDELDDIDRKIILLTAVEGFTFAETSRILNMPSGTIGRRRHTALKKLQRVFGNSKPVEAALN